MKHPVNAKNSKPYYNYLGWSCHVWKLCSTVLNQFSLPFVQTKMQSKMHHTFLTRTNKKTSCKELTVLHIYSVDNYLWWSCHVWELQLCLEQEFWPHPSQLRRPWTHWSGPAAPTASIAIPDSSGHLQTCFLYHYSCFSFLFSSFFQIIQLNFVFVFRFICFFLILFLFCMSRDHLNSFNVVTII